MKPILFPEGQKDFSTNGLGRLPDDSFKVTEERNGQYELHMEYPIDGQLMEEIKYSRIIYATPADGKRPQPFRIYRITKPLSGVVEIDAEHISYQMRHTLKSSAVQAVVGLFLPFESRFFRLFNIFVGVGFYRLFKVRWKMGGKSTIEKCLS